MDILSMFSGADGKGKIQDVLTDPQKVKQFLPI